MVTADLSIADLVLQAQDGDSDAFGVLYERFYRVVRRKVSIIANSSDVDDITQDAFVRAFMRLGQLRKPCFFKAWVTMIAARMARSYYRAKKVKVCDTNNPEAREQVCSLPDPVEAVEILERKQDVHFVLRRLCAGDRKMLIAFYWRGLKTREMADCFRKPEGTVKRVLHDARIRLCHGLVARRSD